MQTIKIVLAAAFGLCFANTTVIASPDWKNAFKEMIKCTGMQDIDCALDLAEKIVLATERGKPFDASVVLKAWPIPSQRYQLLNDLVVQRAKRGQMKKAEEVYAIAFRERIGAGILSSGRPINTAQEWLALGYLRTGSASNFMRVINHSHGYEGRIVPPEQRARKIAKVIGVLRTTGLEFDQIEAAKILGAWITTQENKQDAVKEVVQALISGGFLGAAAIVLEKFENPGLFQKLADAHEREGKWQAKIEATATLLENSDLAGAVAKALEDKTLAKTLPVIHFRREVEKLVTAYTQSGRSQLVRPLLLAAGQFGGKLLDRNCKILLMKTLINKAIAIDDKVAFAELSRMLRLKDSALSKKAKCGGSRVRFGQSDIDLAYAMMGGKAEENSFFSPAAYAKSTQSQFAAIYQMLRSAPNLAPSRITYLLERDAMMKTADMPNKLPITLAHVSSLAVQNGYDAAALGILNRLFSNQRETTLPKTAKSDETRQTPLAGTGLANRDERVLMRAFSSLFHWRHLLFGLQAKAHIR